MQPSMAGVKLSGLLRSALKNCSFWDAPGRLVRKLTSFLCWSDYVQNKQKSYFSLEDQIKLVVAIVVIYSYCQGSKL